MSDTPKFEVLVLKRARQQLVRHAAFLAKVSPPAAKRLVDSFEEGAASLSTMPNRCPRLVMGESPKLDYRFLLIEKRYALIFRVKAHTVYIYHVVDCRQDYRWLID